MSKTKNIFILFGVFQILSYKAQVPCNLANTPTFQIITSQATLATNGFCGMQINIVNAGTIPPGGAVSYSFIAPGQTSYAVGPIPSILAVSGTWTLTVKDDVNACMSSQTVQVNVLQAPTISITASQSIICSGSLVTLTANGANSYTWSTNSTSATVSVTPSTVSTYSVIATGTNVCANTATSIVNIYPQPNIIITANQDSVCLNESITFTANGANTYTWSSSQTGATITISPTVTTLYSVIGENANGCKSNSQILVSVSPCTYIEDIKVEKEEITIYPVPAGDQIELILSNIKLIKEFHYLLIYNNHGLLIREEEIMLDIRSLKIKTDDLINGVYFLQLKSNKNETVSKRFVISR